MLQFNIKNVNCEERERERDTNARMQAVTPVPQEATTGLSKDMPAKMDQSFSILIFNSRPLKKVEREIK